MATINVRKHLVLYPQISNTLSVTEFSYIVFAYQLAVFLLRTARITGLPLWLLSLWSAIIKTLEAPTFRRPSKPV